MEKIQNNKEIFTYKTTIHDDDDSSSSNDSNDELSDYEDKSKMKNKRNRSNSDYTINNKTRKHSEIYIHTANINSNYNYTENIIRNKYDKNDNICGKCYKILKKKDENNIETIMKCTGPCLSSFHAGCIGLSNRKIISRRLNNWLCFSCENNIHECFICGEKEQKMSVIKISDDKKILKTYRCTAISCGKFYHQKCIEKHPLARIFGKKKFVCPRHTCCKCKDSGGPTCSSKYIICVKCPNTFHINCISVEDDVAMNLNEGRIICCRHSKETLSVKEDNSVHVEPINEIKEETHEDNVFIDSKEFNAEEEKMNFNLNNGDSSIEEKEQTQNINVSTDKLAEIKINSNVTSIDDADIDNIDSSNSNLTSEEYDSSDQISKTSDSRTSCDKVVGDISSTRSRKSKKIFENFEQCEDTNVTNAEDVETSELLHIDESKPLGTSPTVEAKWVQCDGCAQWRVIPPEIDLNSLPEKWFCHMNTWNPRLAVCGAVDDITNGVIYDGSHKNISRRMDAKNTLENSKKKKKTGRKRKMKYKEMRWVQCERTDCKKWRVVAPSVDFGSLPSKWYCHMNTWDSSLASCSTSNPPEIEALISQHDMLYGKRSHKSTTKHRSVSTTKISPRSTAGIQYLKGFNDGDIEYVSQAIRNSPKTNPTPKNSKHNNSNNIQFYNSKPSSKISPKIYTDQQGFPYVSETLSSNSRGRKSKQTAGNDRLIKKTIWEWVECEKCKKWRRLPQHVKFSSLPEHWVCSMNSWNPLTASCLAPEEEDSQACPGIDIDGNGTCISEEWVLSEETNPPPNSSVNTPSQGLKKKKGKLSYRDLLYASSGHIKKAYTSESSSLVFEYNGVITERDDQYAESSHYCRPSDFDTSLHENQPLSFEACILNEPSISMSEEEERNLEELVLQQLNIHGKSAAEVSIALHCSNHMTEPSDKPAYKNGSSYSIRQIMSVIQKMAEKGIIERFMPQPSFNLNDHHVGDIQQLLLKREQLNMKNEEFDEKIQSLIEYDSLISSWNLSKPGYIFPTIEPLYRRMPKKPLKNSKPWKKGEFIIG